MIHMYPEKTASWGNFLCRVSRDKLSKNARETLKLNMQAFWCRNKMSENGLNEAQNLVSAFELRTNLQVW